jgi:phosphoribosylformylglycinamidine cyclo-ligase
VVVGLGEPGLRSNGFSLARRILGRAYGERWHERPCAADDSHRTWGELLLTPSRICCSVVTHLIAAGVVPHGIAHITGGGIPSKLGRVLRRAGLGAELDRLPEPPAFMSELGALGNCPRAQAVHHWNMGTAMLLLVAPTDLTATVEAASAEGHRASAIGAVVDRPALQLWSGPSAVRVELGGSGARP